MIIANTLSVYLYLHGADVPAPSAKLKDIIMSFCFSFLLRALRSAPIHVRDHYVIVMIIIIMFIIINVKLVIK